MFAKKKVKIAYYFFCDIILIYIYSFFISEINFFPITTCDLKVYNLAVDSAIFYHQIKDDFW